MSVRHICVSFLGDVRYAGRVLRRDLLFSIPVVVCIALVIAANSSVFSVVDALLLRVVPFENPERLLVLSALHSTPGETEEQQMLVSPKDFVAWREQAESFEAMSGVYVRNFNIAAVSEGASEGDMVEPERIVGAKVSPDLFALLGVGPAFGRAFTPAEEHPGLEQTVILSHRLWQRRFGGDPDIVGKTMLVDGASNTIVGVMPEDFSYPGESMLWAPLVLYPDSPTHLWNYVEPLGRLAPGVSAAQAEAELVTIARRLEEEFPTTNQDWSAKVELLSESLIGDLRPRLLTLFAGVGFLLLIACANLANLLLARSTARSKEMAIRSSQGGSRARLMRLMLVEGICLALCGGGVGLLLTYLAIPVIASAPIDIPALGNISLDLRNLGFTFLITVATGLLFSLAPALRLSRPELQPLLKEGSRGSTQGVAGYRLQQLFVVLQIAVTMVLLTSAGLLLRSFQALRSEDPGFDTQGILTLRASLPDSRYPGNPERALFAEEAVRRLQEIPGVRDAALTTAFPIGGRDIDFSDSFNIEGRIPSNEGASYVAKIRRVTPSYFQTMGIPLVQGRHFSVTDHADSPGVVIVSRSFAQEYWPGESALDKRIKRGTYDSENPWLTIVGVVEDVKDDGLGSGHQPIWYQPYSQHGDKSARYITLVLKTEGDPKSLIRAVREEIGGIDHTLPLYGIATFDEVIADSLAQNRLLTLLLGVLSLIGLALAAVGLYGVMSYVVSQRSHEVGIRVAMGADRGHVLGLVLSRGMKLVAFGLALGVAATFLLTRLITSLLYGVRPGDPLTFVVIAVTLTLVAVLANLVPAYRATQVDPLAVLHCE